MKTIEQVKEIGISALKAAYDKVKKLGDAGKKPVFNPKHRFVKDASTIFLGDVQAEKAALSELTEAGLPIRVISEEHDETNILPSPEHLGILDGIDGSKLYEEGKPGCGTMFAIFSGVNPTHDDYLFSGIVDLESGKIFFATKGNGAQVTSVEGQKNAPGERLATSQKTSFDNDIHMYLHRRVEALTRAFDGRECSSLTCCSLAFTDIVLGKAHLIVELARKDNLEQAIAYGLVKEAGGVMVTQDGKSIGERKYFEFIRAENKPIIITAANEELAKNFLDKVKLPS